VIFSAPLLGVVFAVILLVREAFKPSGDAGESSEPETPFLSREMPFGVFLGGASLGAVFFGEAVLRWYVRMI
jgi:hypothetical protein